MISITIISKPVKKILEDPKRNNLLNLNGRDYDNLSSFFLIANRLQTFIFQSDDYSRRMLMDILCPILSHLVRARLDADALRARTSEQELLK